MQEGRAGGSHCPKASRIKGLSTNAAPHATNEERAAIAKSSAHAPKESETLYPASQRKKAP